MVILTGKEGRTTRVSIFKIMSNGHVSGSPMSFGQHPKILSGDVSKRLVFFVIQLLCDVLIPKETKETTEEKL